MREIKVKRFIDVARSGFVCSAFACVATALFPTDSAAQSTPATAQATPAAAPVQQSPEQLLVKLEELVEQENYLEAQDLIKSIPDAQISKSPRLLVCKALIAKGLYRPDESFDLLRTALRLDRNFPAAQYEIAMFLLERKEWSEAEVLLRLAASSDALSRARRLMIPYYLGVIAFETGRLFDARSSFMRLTWHETLDPAIQQSLGLFITRISKQRPWTLVSPLTFQFESNVLGLSRTTPLPEEFDRRSGFKLIGGLFANVEGLLGENKGDGPVGLGARVFAIQNLDPKFSALNVVFAEAEANWSRYQGETLGLLKMALTANLIRAGGQSLSSSVAVKSALFQTDVSVAYESDLQKTSLADRTSILFRAYRDQTLANPGKVSITLPLDSGYKHPLKNTPGEKKYDISANPTLGYASSRRFSLKLSERLAYETTSSNVSATIHVVRSAPALNLSFNLQPWLVVSASTSYEWERNLGTRSTVQKSTYASTILGIF